MLFDLMFFRGWREYYFTIFIVTSLGFFIDSVINFNLGFDYYLTRLYLASLLLIYIILDFYVYLQ
jgi:hypothetical protein